jgi:hypothetical protein
VSSALTWVKASGIFYDHVAAMAFIAFGFNPGAFAGLGKGMSEEA